MARRERDYRAEYQADKARARLLGYRSQRERKAARAEGRMRAGDTPLRRMAARQIVRLPGGRSIVQTTPHGRGWAVIESRMRNAPPGAHVAQALVTWVGTDGVEYQTTIWGKGATAGWVADRMASMGAHDLISDQLVKSAALRYAIGPDSDVEIAEVTGVQITLEPGKGS